MQFRAGDGRIYDLDDSSEVAEYIGGLSPAHLPGFDVTLARGDLWAFPPPMATESTLFRVLDAKEIKARSDKSGAIQTKAWPGPDPVTGLTRAMQEEAIREGRPIPQLAAEVNEDGSPNVGTVAEEA